MKCIKCGTTMRHTYTFEVNKAKEFYRCPVCYYETNKNNIIWPNDRTQENYRTSNTKRMRKHNVQRVYYNNKRSAKTQQCRQVTMCNDLRK